jgi:hypothetical protein|tara:strand:- start:1384 stop:1551 length:168 start_codon:yes stop_codon:yes gene_type:complete
MKCQKEQLATDKSNLEISLKRQNKNCIQSCDDDYSRQDSEYEIANSVPEINHSIA